TRSIRGTQPELGAEPTHRTLSRRRIAPRDRTRSHRPVLRAPILIADRGVAHPRPTFRSLASSVEDPGPCDVRESPLALPPVEAWGWRPERALRDQQT